ncbi:MAG: hypothetical protein AVDCRST_MAG93-78 [uncultured Chloroflexia bacterium]|uniref:Uncharacterized protein n=1 Tax=uncultured Chloroflexia bacterium TaxID=1672391 RepID=A0A6J4H3H7_9CHLR|nr:MAG: hypothetical protein AVDCRST_MAG93-78 [uncultured Chloroflexia bacterium]
MSDREDSAKNEGLESEHQALTSAVDTRKEAPGAATGAEQPVSDVGSLGVGHAGDLGDVDPLAIGLNDESSTLGEVITEVMDDNHTEGAQDSPSK